MITLQNISFSLLDIVSIFAVYLMASIYVGATFFFKRMPYFVGYTYLCISMSALLTNFIVAKGLYGDANKFFHHWGVVGVVGTMIVLMFVFFKNPKEKDKDICWNNYYYDTKREQYNNQQYQQQKADQYLYEQLKENRDREIDSNYAYKAESKGGVYQQWATNNGGFNGDRLNSYYKNAYLNDRGDNIINNRNFGNTETNNNINNNYNDNENYNASCNKGDHQTHCNINKEVINTDNTRQQLSINKDFEKDILSKAKDMFYNSQLPVKQDVDRLKNDITLIHNDVQKIVDRIAQLFSLISLVLKK